MTKNFITFEGPDTSGKTTAIRGLIKYLKKEYPDLEFIFTREPGGSKIGENIRKMILNNENIDMDYVVEALLYAASRRQHLTSTILPALNSNKLVLCDRYIDSSLAYQGYARNLGIEYVEKLNILATDNTWPTLTIFFDLPISEIKKRLSNKKNADRIENENIDFMERVNLGYKEIIKKYKDRFVVIDATLSKEKVLDEIINIIKSYI